MCTPTMSTRRRITRNANMKPTVCHVLAHKCPCLLDVLYLCANMCVLYLCKNVPVGSMCLYLCTELCFVLVQNVSANLEQHDSGAATCRTPLVVYIYIYIYIYVYTHTHTYTYTCIHTRIHTTHYEHYYYSIMCYNNEFVLHSYITL